MLGKRFRRTTSMSHLGPGCHNIPTIAVTSEERHGMEASNIVSSVPHKAARQSISQEEENYQIVEGRGGSDAHEGDGNMRDVIARQLILQGEELYGIVKGHGGGGAHEGDANMGDVIAGFDFSEKRSQYQGVEEYITVLYDGDMNMEGIAPGLELPQVIPDTIFTSPLFQAHGESPPVQVLPPPLVAFQMGLWNHNNSGLGPHLGYSISLGKLEDNAEFMSPVDFLDVCFFCKRRLQHERDIFIYRGDTAFCSEECRHRQILSDERRSLRAASKSTKRGPRATSSQTAVAA